MVNVVTLFQAPEPTSDVLVTDDTGSTQIISQDDLDADNGDGNDSDDQS